MSEQQSSTLTTATDKGIAAAGEKFPETRDNNTRIALAAINQAMAPTTARLIRACDPTAADCYRNLGAIVPEMMELGRVVDCPIKTRVAIFEFATMMSDSEIVAARKCHAEFSALDTEAQKFSGLAAFEKYTKQLEDITEKHAAGESLHGNIHFRTRDDISRDFRHKSSVLQARAGVYANQAVELARPVLQRSVEYLAVWLAETEQAEREVSEVYGLPFHPSLVWKSVANYFSQLMTGQALHLCGQSPKSMFAAIGVNL